VANEVFVSLHYSKRFFKQILSL